MNNNNNNANVNVPRGGPAGQGLPRRRRGNGGARNAAAFQNLLNQFAAANFGFRNVQAPPPLVAVGPAAPPIPAVPIVNNPAGPPQVGAGVGVVGRREMDLMHKWKAAFTRWRLSIVAYPPGLVMGFAGIKGKSCTQMLNYILLMVLLVTLFVFSIFAKYFQLMTAVRNDKFGDPFDSVELVWSNHMCFDSSDICSGLYSPLMNREVDIRWE
jgi:hypothetical protein